MDLAKLVKLPGGDEGAWFKHSTGCEVKIAYIDSDRLRRLQKAAASAGDDYDSGLQERFADAAILDWRGMTAKVVAQLFPGMSEENLAKIPESGLECTPANKSAAMKLCPKFGLWVSQISADRARYVEERKELERGNS